MEKHKGWIRYTNGTDVTTTHEDYYSQYLPRKKEQLDNTFVDQSEEMVRNLPEIIMDTANKGKQHLKGDFFIEVVIKSERLLEGLTKNIVVARPTCPSPSFDRIVYQYHSNSGEVELLWAIPTPSKCSQSLGVDYLSVKKDDRLLHEYIVKFFNGELHELERKKNSSLGPKKKIVLTDLQ